MTRSFLTQAVAKLTSLVEATVKLSEGQGEEYAGSSWYDHEVLTDAIKLVQGAGQAIQGTVTKFSLVMSTSPNDEVASSICKELIATCDTITAALGVLLEPSCGAGLALRDYYAREIRAILRSVQDLVVDVNKGEIHLAPKSGAVWEACERLDKLPKSNKVAYQRKIMEQCGDIRDIIREFKEINEGQDAKDDQGQLADALEELNVGGDEEDGDDFYFDGGGDQECNEEEKVRIDMAIQVFEESVNLFKVLLRVEETVAAAETGGATITMALAGRIHKQSEELTMALYEAGDSLYPPQIPEEVKERMGGVVRLVTEMVQSVSEVATDGKAVEQAEEIKQILMRIRKVVGGVGDSLTSSLVCQDPS